MLELANDQNPSLSDSRQFSMKVNDDLSLTGSRSIFPFPHQAGSRKAGYQDERGNLNITQLLEHMALQGKRIAVERNGEIVPRSKFDRADADRWGSA